VLKLFPNIKLSHPLEGTIINPHTVNSSCILNGFRYRRKTGSLQISVRFSCINESISKNNAITVIVIRREEEELEEE